MSTNMKPVPTIYLKYHPSDAEFAMSIVDALESVGFKIWAKDRHAIAGRRLDRQLESILDETNTILFLLSKTAIASKTLVEEVLLLQREGKKVLPLQIESCELPRTLQRIQFIDVHTDRTSGIKKLLKELAMSGHQYNGLQKEVLEVLSENEKLLLARKEAAKQKMNQIEAKRRRTKNTFVGLGILIVGFLAYLTFEYAGRDKKDFDNIDFTYNINNITNKDTMELVREQFDLHIEKFQFCRHGVLMTKISEDFDITYGENGFDHEDLVRQNDSLRKLIKRLKMK